MSYKGAAILPAVIVYHVPVVALFQRVRLADFFTNLGKAQAQHAINLSLFTSLVTMAIT